MPRIGLRNGLVSGIDFASEFLAFRADTAADMRARPDESANSGCRSRRLGWVSAVGLDAALIAFARSGPRPDLETSHLGSQWSNQLGWLYRADLGTLLKDSGREVATREQLMNGAITSWTVVERAGRGDREARETLARVYLPIVQRYVGARWQGTPWQSEIEDATNQVFVECLKADGPLSRVSRDDPWSFRSYLFGVTRNVARSFEKRPRPECNGVPLEPPVAEESGLQQAFDRSYVEALLAEALERHHQQAEDEGEAALRRFELLRLRFWERRPIREIAGLWSVDAAQLHHDYARARVEFRDALRSVVADHCGPHAKVTESELADLLSSD